MAYSSMLMGLSYDFAFTARSRMKVFSSQRLRSSSALTFELSRFTWIVAKSSHADDAMPIQLPGPAAAWTSHDAPPSVLV
jgi:hypothetical protein